MPFFDAEDANLTDTFYFRTYSYHNHIHYAAPPVANYTVVTEFYPDVPWAGPLNAISCAAGHHIREGTWLRDRSIIDSYLRYWYAPDGGHPDTYTIWAISAGLGRAAFTGNLTLLDELFPAMAADYLHMFEQQFSLQHRCYFQQAGREGEENSVGGNGCRPVSNSIVFGEARALAVLAKRAANATALALFQNHTELFQAAVLSRLWHPQLEFFVTLSLSQANPPPPPPPPPQPPTPDFVLYNQDRFCCDQSPCVDGHSTFLWEGAVNASTCANKCTQGPLSILCRFITVKLDSGPYCQLSQYCNTTGSFASGPAATFEREIGSAAPSQPGPPDTPPAPSDPPSPGAQCPWSNKEDPNANWVEGQLVSVREIMGLTSPWYFHLPPPGNFSAYLAGFSQLEDSQGFQGPYGLRTAELRTPCYNFTQFVPLAKRHECNWNGPSWPFETAKLLTAMANILHDYPPQTAVTAASFLGQLRLFAQQHLAGQVVNGSQPWIGESMHPDTGVWLSRAIMYEQPNRTDRNRGVWYNHSTFLDLILRGFVGLRAAGGELHAATAGGCGSFFVSPAAVDQAFFAVDNLRLWSSDVAIVWDRDGSRYHLKAGKGLHVLVDGAVVASRPDLGRLDFSLPCA